MDPTPYNLLRAAFEAKESHKLVVCALSICEWILLFGWRRAVDDRGGWGVGRLPTTRNIFHIFSW